MCTSGLAAILNERLPVISERFGVSCVVVPVSENMVLAFETVLLYCPRADSCALPV